MPWCPKCKTEYRDGIEKCSECGTTLVAQLEESEKAAATYENVHQEYDKLVNGPSTAYVKKEDKYRDLKSTFQIFFVFGVLMIIFDILNITGTFHLFSNWLQHIVILATSIAFIIVAIRSKMQAKIVYSEIGTEQSISTEVADYLKESYPEDRCKTLYQKDFASEENFIAITDQIKTELKVKFPTVDDSFLDELVEDFYDKNIEA